MVKEILIINGPNLNMLGKREPEIYGHQTLDDIKQLCEAAGKDNSIAIDFRQSNTEGEIVDWIHEAIKKSDAIIINAGAYTHTSVAIRDALLNFDKPIIELHISNIFKREEFRHHSYISDIATGLICGLGASGYTLAIKAAKEII